MKKLLKLVMVLTVILSLIPSALFNTKAIAATTTFVIKSGGTDYGYYKGKGANYVEGRDRVDYMIDTLGNAVFCLQFDKKSANSSVAYTKGNDLDYRVDYIVQAFYNKGAGAQYMKGDEYKKYFIAQNAIRLVLGQSTARVKANNQGLDQGHGADVALIDNINNLATAAKNAPKPAAPTLTGALNFSNVNLTFTKATDGNYYTQVTKATSTTNGKLTSAVVTGNFPTGVSFVNTSNGALNSVTANQEFKLKATPAAVEGKSISISLNATAKYELGYPVPIQYTPNNTAFQTVTGYDYDYLNLSKTATATAKIDDRRGTLKILKLDDKGNKLAGVSFTVLDSANKEVAAITADEKGEATVSNLLPAVYTVKEVKGKKGYVVDGKPQVATVPINGVARLTFVNKLMSGVVKLQKVDQDGNSLAGAEVTLVDDDGKSLVEVTDKDGMAAFNILANKVYTMEETKNPLGYHGTFKKEGITLENDGQVFEYKAVNMLNKGMLTFQKTDEKGAKLAGAEVTLTDAAGKKVVKVTDKEGLATFELEGLNSYTLEETKNPLGYIGTFKKEGITLANNGDSLSYTAKNTLIKGKVRVHKIDQDGKDLANAEFTLFDSEGKKYVQVTDDKGIAEFDGVALKKYVLEETKNPEGYTGAYKQAGIEITQEGQILEYTAKNTKDVVKVSKIVKVEKAKVEKVKTEKKAAVQKLAKTGDSTNWYGVLLGLVLCACGIILIRFGKKMKKKTK